jgi:hypothetical protein
MKQSRVPYAAALAILIATAVSAAPVNDGRIVYSNNTTTPQSRPYGALTSTFGANQNPATTAAQSWSVLRACPTRNEMIYAYAAGTTLYVTRWNGAAWQAAFNVAGPTVTGRWFDVAYETTSGEAIVVYSTGATASAELAYRTWNGATWSGATTITSNRTAAAVNWVKLASNPQSNAVALAFSDTAQDLSSWIWTGTAWNYEPTAAHETSLSRSVTSGDYDTFDLAYEAAGDLILVWGSENTTYNDARYRTFIGTTWGTTAEVANLGFVPAHVALAADPASNDILLAYSRDAGSTNFYGSHWNGTAWDTPTQLGTVSGAAAPIASAVNRRPFHPVWLTSGLLKIGLIAYSTSAATNTISYFWHDAAGTGWNYGTWTPGGTAIAAEQWLYAAADPAGTDTALVTFSDTNSDLWAKRVVLSSGPVFTWSNADGGTAITTAMSALTTENFRFAYDRLTKVLTVGDGTTVSNASRCPGDGVATVDSFTLQMNYGTDSVSAINVTLAAGAWEGLQLVLITDDTEATVYGSATPAGNDVAIAVSLTATSVPVQYRVRVEPRSHAAMTPKPGATYGVTANVTAVTSGAQKTYSDAASATVTIDNASPAEATWGTNTAGNGSVVLQWTNPVSDFSGVVILRNTVAPISDVPAEGSAYTAPGVIGSSDIVYVGSLQTFTDSTVTNGTTYVYKIFALDACLNDSAGVQSASLKPTAPNPKVRALPAAGSIDSCTQISLSAPYDQDTPVANNSVTFERATAIGGPFTTVCASVITGNPRTCVSGVLTAGTTFYYRVTFADADGVDGQNPQIVGPFTTPATCAANATTTGTATAQLSSCKQLTVSAPFTGDGDGDGSVRVEFNTTNSWPGTVSCDAVTGSSPRQCLVTGLTASTQYWIRVTWSDPDTVTGTSPQVLGPATTPACGADEAPPTILFLTPAKNAILGGTDTVKVQVWDAVGLAASNPVQWSVDGGASSVAVAINANYSCGTGCSVYELTLDTSALATGPHYITVQATDAASNVARASQSFRAQSASTLPQGGGTLLRRTHSSQLCADCHAMSTHSSQTANSTKYGNWAIDCLTCHTPHKTTNIALIRPVIETPNSGAAAVAFRQNDKSGQTNPQYGQLGDYSGGGGVPYTDGICETCHTKTLHHRNSTSGGDHTHKQGERCTGCHPHAKGFGGGESRGGQRCADCHAAIWRGMTGAVAKTSKHMLGNADGVNDGTTDNAVTYGSPLRTSVPAAQRLCLSCHQDHVHNAVAGSTHDYNVHRDASTQAARMVTRDANGNITGGTPARTDFDAAATNGGMCLSCHRNALDAGGTPIDKAAYGASAHNYVTFSTYGSWLYTQHDGATFDRNCTKCHADRNDAQNASSTPFGSVHYSDYPMVLAGSKNPNGAPATFVCFNCHGNGTVGTNRSGKNIASLVAKTRAHPTNADAVHAESEYANAAFGNALGGVARHSGCMDCHDTHKAKAGVHTTGTNLAGPSLEGAWGAQLSTFPARWAAPTSANFTKRRIVAGTDAEATLCFKCHSSYYGTRPNSPSGGFAETDVARELNPNNASSGATAGGYHPVLASAGGNLGATSNIKTPWTRTSLMTCSDCHASDTTTDPAGPHGSAAGFLLKGPNTTWNNSIATASTGMPNGTFCINCHNQNFTSTRFPDHATRADHLVACWNCHSAIPHGTARPGLLVGVDQSTYGDKSTDVAPWRQMPAATADGLYIKSYPANNTTNWSQSNCGCGTSGGH